MKLTPSLWPISYWVLVTIHLVLVEREVRLPCNCMTGRTLFIDKPKFVVKLFYLCIYRVVLKMWRPLLRPLIFDMSSGVITAADYAMILLSFISDADTLTVLYSLALIMFFFTSDTEIYRWLDCDEVLLFALFRFKAL